MQNIRKKIIETSYRAGACHIGSALSCVEILEAMSKVKHDVFIFSKASGVCAYYCLKYPVDKAVRLLKKYPLPNKKAGLIWSGGSLGQGLSVACGTALTGKKTFVLLSDGELQEGQTWEAVMFANHYKLKIVAVIDRNGLQALGDTERIIKLEPLKAKFKAFGWDVAEVDGHDLKSLLQALQGKKFPLAVIARTTKGKGVDFLEGKKESHYLNLDEDGYKKAIFQTTDTKSQKG